MRMRRSLVIFATLISPVCGVNLWAYPGGYLSPRDSAHFSTSADWESDSYFGVYLQDVTADEAEELKLPAERGALLAKIIADGPADEAGLQSRDVVMSWNKIPVESARQLKRLVKETPAGRKVTLEYFREGVSQRVEVIIGKRGDLEIGHGEFPFPGANRFSRPFRDWHPPLDDSSRWYDFPPESIGKARLGVMLQPLTDQLAEFFGLTEGREGVLIASVLANSVAEKYGLKAGDVLLEVGGEPASSVQHVQRQVREAEGLVDLEIMRDHEVMHIEVNLDSGEESDAAAANDDDLENRDETNEVPGEVSFPKQAM